MPQTRVGSVRRAVAPVSGRCRTGRQRIYILTLPTRRAGHMLCCAACALFFFSLGFYRLDYYYYYYYIQGVCCSFQLLSIRQGNPRVWLSCIFGYPVVSRACIYLLFTFFSFRQWHDALLKIVSSSPARCYFFLFFFCLPYIVISWRSTKKKKKQIKTKCNEAVPLAQSFVCSRSNSKWQIVSLFVLI
ncbi:hypothetical protein FIM1_280 [Kluyveromyces marxianus]|uniref:Uncharacterized protein n=1 Tax=Kluyveromyces marxianus TaxID=4911 RepID=A0ABX6EN68_KLUMA|nr:hypothetical protein FIM1_280 [Kluyveromyces marxianus]